MAALESALQQVDWASQRRDQVLRAELATLHARQADTADALRAYTDTHDPNRNNNNNNNGNDSAAAAVADAVEEARQAWLDQAREMQQQQRRLESQLSSLLRMPTSSNSSSGSEDSHNDNHDANTTRASDSAMQRNLAAMQGRMSELESQLDAMRQTVETAGRQNARQERRATRTAVESAEGGEGAVAALRESVSGLREDVTAMQRELQEQADYASQLQSSKVDREELEEMARRVESKDRIDSADVTHRLSPLQERLDMLQSQLYRLDAEKASEEDVQRLVSNLNNLKILMDIHAKRDTTAASRGDGEPLPHDLDRILRDMQQQIISQEDRMLRQSDGQRDSVEELREMLEQLDHRKADATLVANKAERDYVENALERLMREVEQVLNATNAGLIDTLDKSLNILRDMMEGKATKQDVLNLQHRMSEEESGRGSADALTGFKGYRCLGCNRTVDNMRPRPLPGRPAPFVTRSTQNLPQDAVTRAAQQQQNTETIIEPRRGPHSTEGGSPSPSQHHRSGHKDPLPRIEN